jgi:hypothetical protein
MDSQVTLAVFASEKGPGDGDRSDTMSQAGSFFAKKGARIICSVSRESMSLPLVKSAAASGGDVLLLALPDFKLPKALKDIAIEHLPTDEAIRARVHELADAYIGLPGSLASTMRMFETWSAQGGNKPVALLNRNKAFEVVRGFGVDILAQGKNNWERDLLVTDNIEDLWHRLPRMLPKAGA